MSSLGQKYGFPPVKMIYEGVDLNTAEGQRLVARMRGQINAFCTGARANAGENYSWSQVRHIPGVEMHYTKNGTLETVRVVISAPPPPKREVEEKPPVEPRELPTHCVVDIVIPSSTTIAADFIAVGVRPDDIVGIEEWDSIVLTEFDSPEIFKFSRNEPVDYASSITNRLGSLLVDLTSDDYLVVEIDLYGKVTPEEFPIIGYNPDSYERTLLYDDNSLESNPSGTPTQVVATHTPFEAYDHITGGVILHAYQPSEAGPGGVWETEDRATYPDYEEFVDPVSGLVNKTISRSYAIEVLSGPTGGFSCPVHGVASNQYMEQHIVNEYWAEWSITPVPGPPIRSDQFETTADIVGALYYKSPKFLVGQTQHKDEGSIWSTKTETPTERRKVGTAALTHADTTGNPGGLTYVGRIKVDRAGKSIKFTPA